MKNAAFKFRRFSNTIKQRNEIPKNLTTAEAIKKLALLPIVPQSLKNLLNFGSEPTLNKLKTSAIYLEKELPIRYARQIKLLDKLP